MLQVATTQAATVESLRRPEAIATPPRLGDARLARAGIPSDIDDPVPLRDGDALLPPANCRLEIAAVTSAMQVQYQVDRPEPPRGTAKPAALASAPIAMPVAPTEPPMPVPPAVWRSRPNRPGSIPQVPRRGDTGAHPRLPSGVSYGHL